MMLVWSAIFACTPAPGPSPVAPPVDALHALTVPTDGTITDDSGTTAPDDTSTSADDSTADDSGTPPDDSSEPVLLADFVLQNLNASSPTYKTMISPRDYLKQVSGWYFTHAT